MMATDTMAEPPEQTTYTVRPGEFREDMFYLKWQYDHYFGAGCDGQGYLPAQLAQILGWYEDDEDPFLDATAPVAVADGVHVGGGVATLGDYESTVETLPSGRYDRGALAGGRSVWLWFNVVDPNWRGHGIGKQHARKPGSVAHALSMKEGRPESR